MLGLISECYHTFVIGGSTVMMTIWTILWAHKRTGLMKLANLLGKLGHWQTPSQSSSSEISRSAPQEGMSPCPPYRP